MTFARAKHRPLVSAKARDNARGQTCTLRLSCCTMDPAQTVLAHLRVFGWAGMTQKPPDYLAVFACHNCHAEIDLRAAEAEWGYDDLLRALGETLMRQFADGIYGVKE